VFTQPQLDKNKKYWRKYI